MRLLDWLVGMFNAIGGGVGQDLVDQMIRTPEEYNKALYDLSLRIAETAVKPLAAVVIAVMAVLELTRVASRAEGDSELAVKIVGMALFRISLVYWAAANSTVFLKAIDAAGQWVTSGFTAAASVTDPVVAGAPLGDSMRDALDKAGWKGQVACLVLLLLPFLASQLAQVVFTVVMMLRFVQIYMLTAFNPLPIAFMGLEQTRSWGVNYFRQYATYVFQCATLYLAVLMYRTLATSVLRPDSYQAGDDLAKWVVGNFANLMIASVLLIGMVVISNGVSKKLFGGE